MATWQFDLHYLPKKAVDSRYAARPITIPKEDFDSIEWWSATTAPVGVIESLSNVLPPAASWSGEIKKWGREDGDRIDLVHAHGTVQNIFVRIDVREISFPFITAVVGLAAQNDWLLRLQDARLLAPSVSDLMSAIQRSSSFRFVVNPKTFLDELDKRRRAEHDGARVIRLKDDP